MTRGYMSKFGTTLEQNRGTRAKVRVTSCRDKQIEMERVRDTGRGKNERERYIERDEESPTSINAGTGDEAI
jgi:hypothetical protein